MTSQKPLNGVPAYLEKLAQEIVNQIEYFDGEAQEIDFALDLDMPGFNVYDSFLYAAVTVDFHREADEHTQHGYVWAINSIYINELTIYAASENWPLEQRAFLSNLKAFAQC
jgi:hypothetical protein